MVTSYFSATIIFEPIELVRRTSAREVTAVHGAGNVAAGVVEHVGAGNALAESKADEERRILVLPAVGSHAGAVHVSQ